MFPMKPLLSILADSLIMSVISFAKEPVNEKCPVCDKTIKLIFHSNYKGQRVAFATGDCKDKFDKAPDKYPVKPTKP